MIIPQELGLKLYIVDVKEHTKGPQVIISRTHPMLLARLFELEVPEIYSGVVEIMGVAREAGVRSKISVMSHSENVDPVELVLPPAFGSRQWSKNSRAKR